MPNYWYYLHYRDDQGRDYASRFDFSEASTARQNHRSSAQFMWKQPHMRDVYVSTLFAADDKRTIEIRPSCRPGEDPDREYVPVPCPPDVSEQLTLGTLSMQGRDMASRRDKAEEQRADLGSSPSTSTDDLPF